MKERSAATAVPHEHARWKPQKKLFGHIQLGIFASTQVVKRQHVILILEINSFNVLFKDQINDVKRRVF